MTSFSIRLGRALVLETADSDITAGAQVIRSQLAIQCRRLVAGCFDCEVLTKAPRRFDPGIALGCQGGPVASHAGDKVAIR